MSKGMSVVIKDGEVVYPEGESFTITDDGDLVVFDQAGGEVARFDVGNWINAFKQL